MPRKLPPAPISVWRPVDLDRFLVGAPHYPEHVEESYWDRDAERMARAGFNVVRMGEFAWHLWEPREGQFSFDLFDRAIEGLGRHGIKTILCTPTATPPRWLTQRYPEVLRVDARGRRASHGSRQHADTSSPVYREHSKRITRALATHYRDNGHVIGWQTDNELNTTESQSFSEATRIEFQLFLERKYDTIDALNYAWGGNFWATHYDSFDQIVLPVDGNPGWVSPGHAQDFHRFLAFATARFQRDQVEILRAANPDWFIFHNLGRLDDIDFRGEFSADVDFMGYDIYPFLYDEMQRDGGHALAQALHLDICRGFSGNFIVPEQQSGFGSQPGFTTLTPEPGEMRRMAYSSVARGADGLLFFRWRPAHYGAEIYWMGIIDHDDIPRRRYEEARQYATEMAALAPILMGTHVRMDVGIAGADFDNQQAHRAYPIGLPSPHDDAVVLYRHCYRAGIACGFIHPEDDLSRLKVFYVPHWLMWKDEWTARLEAFAQNGGTVVFSARTGSRDANNHIIRTPAPGRSISDLAGVSVVEFGRIAGLNSDGLFDPGFVRTGVVRQTHAAESARRRHTLRLGNHDMTAAHMYELLDLAPDVEIIGKWSSRFAEGQPAVTARRVGKGRVVYVGTYLTDELADALATDIIAGAGVQPLLPVVPEGVEVTIRESDNRRLLFVLNTQAEPAALNGLPVGETLVGDASIVDGRAVLPAYGCLVIQMA